MKATTAIFAALLGACAFTVPQANAAELNPASLHRAVHSGLLTPGEAGVARAELNRLRRAHRLALRDGWISPAERVRLARLDRRADAQFTHLLRNRARR